MGYFRFCLWLGLSSVAAAAQLFVPAVTLRPAYERSAAQDTAQSAGPTPQIFAPGIISRQRRFANFFPGRQHALFHA
jgi:hypothetical protein